MIVTPLDSAVLDSKEQYVFYHKMVKFALKEVLARIEEESLLTRQEYIFLKQYLELLLYSLEAMRVKYMYDDEDNMKVDLTDSGFPNYLEFRYLYNDLELRNDYINKLQDIAILKQEVLDTLFKKKAPISRQQLFQASSIVYYSSVKQEYIFNRFVQGKIIENPEQTGAKYMTSWSFYDVSTNRPYVCYLYFDYDGKRIDDYKEELYQALKTSADREMSLDTMAYNIDRKTKNIYPKHIKRIDLGPFHNVFAKDENEITHAILGAIGKKEIPLESYAISLKVDELFSGDTFKEGGFFNKQTLQKWNEVAQEKYVFAPHRIIQLLHNKTPEVLDKLAKPPIQIDNLTVIS